MYLVFLSFLIININTNNLGYLIQVFQDLGDWIGKKITEKDTYDKAIEKMAKLGN